MALATVTGLDRQGYFIPCRHAGVFPAIAGYQVVERLFASHLESFCEVITDLEQFRDDLKAIGHDDPAPGPRWNQDWFPRLDAAVLYAMVRRWQPSRIVEIGSGHSTRFMARAIADGAVSTRLVAIDPEPRARLPVHGVTWMQDMLHDADPAVVEDLGKGDMLFIDSSHVAMPGSDVDELFNRIVPDLPVGVIVHVHDIFLPFGYPRAWDWRGYNEQLVVAPMLTGGSWTPLFASHYMTRRHPDRLETGVLGDIPLLPGAIETSLWMTRS